MWAHLRAFCAEHTWFEGSSHVEPGRNRAGRKVKSRQEPCVGKMVPRQVETSCG